MVGLRVGVVVSGSPSVGLEEVGDKVVVRPSAEASEGLDVIVITMVGEDVAA